MEIDLDIKTVATRKVVSKSPQKRSHTDGKAMFKLEKNQLPHGKYMFGTDLPVGTFDFTWGTSEINMSMSIGSVCMYNVSPEIC